MNKISGLNFENDFKNYLKKSGLDLNLSKSNILVNKYIKAEFARQLFGDSKYYEQILATDLMIKRVLKS